ncbi:BTAD domain-containing putative transcriptional regulator [Streptomyces sp. NPDC052192]|uniref:AfsR/SARP family transcriptional regulator n=1 Tax=Streptomyces sp. NPDC052192 TaxID=3155052 RepID=UPI00341EDA34
MRNGLRFGLLGPPVLHGADGEVVPIGSGKTRALLAALLLEPGRVVSVDALKDALWGGAPPASAQASLHNHVTRLRRLLDDPERLRAVPPGYVLRVAEGELDVRLFERHATAARDAHAGHDAERALRESAAALALWRGTPLSGLPPETGGHALVQRLEEARLLVLEWGYEAELRLAPTAARLDGLAPELSARIAEHPLRESFHRLLMLVLHRTGRPAEALAVHRDLRARLIEELGIEPGPAVREAHLEILRATDRDAHITPAAVRTPGTARTRPEDGNRARRRTGDTGRADHSGAPTGDGDRTGTRTGDAEGTGTGSGTRAGTEDDADREGRAPAPLSRPAQLPPPPAHFMGRVDLRDQLVRILRPQQPAAFPEPPPRSGGGWHPHCTAPASTRVTVISGMAGVGKSALALHVAHELRERFPDGQLYVNLHGATPGMTPITAGQALAALLRDLGVEPRRVPENADAAAALLRSTLAPTRTLMVLDDAAHAAQVRPLLPAGPDCAVIVTSRSPLTALDGAHRFPLAPLTDEDSAALLRAVSGREDGLDSGHPLVELTGRLPLALRVVAARLAARGALTPDALAGQLAATEGRLHHLEYDDLSVRRSLAVAHDALRASDREADRDAALALCRIGALDLPVYGAALLARLTGTGERRAEAALDRLVDVALLEETAYGRYAPHDLVRDFAREIAGAAECVLAMRGPVPDAASPRPDGSGAVVPAPEPGVRGPDGPGDLPATGPDGHDAIVAERALRWYAAVAARSLEAILEPGLDREDRSRPTASQPAGHPADVASAPAFRSAREAFAWGDSELANAVALAERYARTSPYVPLLARMLNPYVQRSGHVAELERLQRAALEGARLLADEAAEAYALGDLGGLHFMTGRAGEALALNDEALAIWRRLGVLSWVRRGLNNRGMLLEGLGRYDESGEALLQSLRFSRELGDPHMEAITYSHLGNLYEHSDPRAAIDHHKRSLAIGEAVQDVIIRHSAHCNIGYAHLTLGEPAAAVPHFEESLRVLGSHGDWHGESQTRLGLVRALRGVGHRERAARECDLLCCRADRRADRYTGGLARHQRGLLLREQGDARAAYREWASALEALEDTDSPVVGELRRLLAT